MQGSRKSWSWRQRERLWMEFSWNLKRTREGWETGLWKCIRRLNRRASVHRPTSWLENQRLPAIFPNPVRITLLKCYSAFLDTMTKELQLYFKEEIIPHGNTWMLSIAWGTPSWKESASSLALLRKTNSRAGGLSYFIIMLCLPPVSVTAILSLVTENKAHLVYPNVNEQSQICGTLAVSIATVGWYFPWVVKTKLYSLFLLLLFLFDFSFSF